MQTRREFLREIVLGILGVSIFPRLASAAPVSLDGLCYGPYREGQQPGVSYPSEAQVMEDLNIMKCFAARIRTYSDENILFDIPEFCNNVGIDCYPGAWIDNLSGDNQQVSDIITIANKGFPTTKGLVVGSEVLLRGNVSKATLISYINQVKTATSVPVTTAEAWHIWNYDSSADLAAAVDFITIHVHPYWESPYWTPNLSIDTAAQHVIDRYNQIKAKYPGKQVVIGETGWPTGGTTVGAAVPSVENQKRFLEEFYDLASGIPYFIFEAFDEPWKIVEGEVGRHWGVYDKDRLAKRSLKNLLYRNFSFTKIEREGPNVRLGVSPTFYGDSYTIDRATKLNEWSALTNFTGKSEVLVPADSLNGFFKAKVEF